MQGWVIQPYRGGVGRGVLRAVIRLSLGSPAAAATAGLSEVELRTGTRATVRGVDVPVNSKAYIADGMITGPAPDLPHFDVDV